MLSWLRLRRISATGLLLFVLSFAPNPALAIPAFPGFPAWDLNTVTGYQNGSWAFGERFTVSAGQDLTVNALGVLDVGQNGFVTTTGLPVGIYHEASGTLLTSTFVTSGDPLSGNYRFHAITPITLLAGESYRVVGVNLNDLYNVAFNPNMVVDPRITWNGYAYGNSTTLQMLSTFTGSEISWFANFNIVDASPALPAPEGGVTLISLGMALAGLSLLRRSSINR